MEKPRTKVWRGQTFDDRALDRRQSLLRAGFELLGDDGVSGVTMRAVCRRAELSPRYFYESFANTDELVVAVYDACNSELGAAIAAVGSRDDLTDTVAAALGVAIGFFDEDQRRVRILLREPLTSALLTDRRAAVLPDFLTTLASALSPAASKAGRTELALAGSALSGALVSLVLDWTDGRLPVTEKQLADYATRLVVATMINL